MPQIAGGCLCGKVRYSATGEPAFVGVCHCTDCQKFTGSAFAMVVGVPKPALTIEGRLARTARPVTPASRSIARSARNAVRPSPMRRMHCRMS